MKIYIAGKITGLDLREAERMFAGAADEVRGLGHEALDPMVMVEQVAVDCVCGHSEGSHLKRSEGHRPVACKIRDCGCEGFVIAGRAYNDMLLDALRIVLNDADALLMLPNWHESKGARIEHAIAGVFGVPVFYSVEELGAVSGKQ
jgi:hypothetical protein